MSSKLGIGVVQVQGMWFFLNLNALEGPSVHSSINIYSLTVMHDLFIFNTFPLFEITAPTPIYNS